MIKRLKDLKKCSYCGKKGHYRKGECGQLKCGYCKKSCHKIMLCLDNMKKLQCNKGKTDDELYDFSKVKKFQTNKVTTVRTATTVAKTISPCSTALPFAMVQLVIKNQLADCKTLFDSL